MSNPNNQEMSENREQSNGDFDEISTGVETSTVGSGAVSFTERLTDILVDESEEDLLIHREDMILQWLQALDMQVMGACRADERLKPLLKINTSNGVAEDPILSHLSKHFEPSEVGMLARCFFIPLVSIRVGKINKQGTMLCPAAARGNLILTLLPTSDLRLSFIGDDGNSERLFTIGSRTQCSAVVVEDIQADSSGRSFFVKIPDDRVFYFWCSEKSKLLGVELLAKMKDILKKKPSVAELTGISKTRLNCFATQLRAYLVGANVGQGSAFSSTCMSTHQSSDAQTPGMRSSRSRHIGSQAVKTNSPYQGSLSPRSSSFKEGLPRSLSSLRNAAREKIRRRGDGHLSTVDNMIDTMPRNVDASSSDQTENEKPMEVHGCPIEPSGFLESLGKLAVPSIVSPAPQVPCLSAPLFTPHYCWCPQGGSSSQYPSSPQLSNSAVESTHLPPISSFLSANMSSSLLTPAPPLNLADIPSMNFPAFLPDPLVRLPVPSSQQIPTFTPLMCDPIVHIPVIDVCSSGQGYLVSAGPAISSTIPPLHSKLVNPLIPEAESMVEKGARETLRLLLSGSSQTTPQLMDVFPTVLTNAGEKQAPFAVGSRGLYTGTRDVDATIANSIATMSLVSFSDNTLGDCVAKMNITSDAYDWLDNCDTSGCKTDGLESSCSDAEDDASDIIGGTN